MAIVIKAELLESNAALVEGIAYASEYALDSGGESINRRCRDFVFYLSGFLAESMPVQAAQLAKVCGRTEGFSK